MAEEKQKKVMSHTFGVKPMPIAGRTVLEKERLDGMSDADRAWRRKWLKDQVLTPREPLLIDVTGPEFMNPIRRFYRKPLDLLFYKVLPIPNKWLASCLRYYTGRALIGIAAVYATFYYFKYNTHTWESHSSWRIIASRKSVLPGDPGYPAIPEAKKPSDYANEGFKDSIFGRGEASTTNC